MNLRKNFLRKKAWEYGKVKFKQRRGKKKGKRRQLENGHHSKTRTESKRPCRRSGSKTEKRPERKPMKRRRPMKRGRPMNRRKPMNKTVAMEMEVEIMMVMDVEITVPMVVGLATCYI
ncbi:hypothetical protein Droror1_Dr00023169 [Drosera rotundifolia]